MAEFKKINLNNIVIENNTRKTFNERKLNELAQSIREVGVREPILVRPLSDGNYGLIAGERRYRACELLGLVDIPAMVENVTDNEHLQINLIENLQREALPYMETAIGIRQMRDKLDLTVPEISKKLGKSEGLLYNLLLLTKVPETVQEVFVREEVTLEVAVMISKLKNPEHQIQAATAFRRKAKDKRVQARSARAYIAESFGTAEAKPKHKNRQKLDSSEYAKNWKKYLIRFSPDQFSKWKNLVAGRIETEVLAEAVETVMMVAESRAESKL